MEDFFLPISNDWERENGSQAGYLKPFTLPSLPQVHVACEGSLARERE